MKIFHLLNSLKHGGAENVALNYSIATKNTNIASVIVGKKDDDNYRNMILNHGIEIYEKLNINLLNSDSAIIIHSNQNLLKLLPYATNLKRIGVKIVYVQHLNYEKRKFSLLSKLINYVCTDFVQITPISTKLINKYIKIKLHFIVNFYINKYSKDEFLTIRTRVREELKIDEQTKLFIFSAVFKPGKGLGEFLEIAAYYKDKKEYKFLILGDGLEREKVERYEFDNMIWLGFQNDVEKYIIAGDVYVFTSMFKQEMMPMAMMEAVNCDKLILAFNTPINQFCLDNKTFNSVTEMLSAIDSDNIPGPFVHYDKLYGIDKIFELICK